MKKEEQTEGTPSGEAHFDSQSCSLRLTALPALKMIRLIVIVRSVRRPAGRVARQPTEA